LNLWPKPAELSVATGHQREQYALATRGPVGILAGNPGVGKSFIVAQIIRAVISEHGVSQTGIACPTGKAAQRINELLLEHSIHGIEATTMHRMLGVSRNGHDRKGWGFIHNSDNPLLKRFVFLDEQSMTDTDLWASTLAAISPGTHVLCVGDFAQLPPVGHGAPLRDMIAAGLPYGELTEVHRNGGDIVTACRDVKEGRPFRPSPCVNLEAGHNLPHVEAARPTLVLGALGNLLRSCPAGIDPVWDVQVLCAINEKSEVSRKLLNAMLQNISEQGRRAGREHALPDERQGHLRHEPDAARRGLPVLQLRQRRISPLERQTKRVQRMRPAVAVEANAGRLCRQRRDWPRVAFGEGALVRLVRCASANGAGRAGRDCGF
jgi:ATP-dependent exoDNAse (exonuclease V) alpha subunit